MLFVWGKSFIDDAIELVTHGPSHCALFLDGQTLAEAQWERTTGTALLSEYLNMKDYRLEVWGDDSLTPDERSGIVEYAKKHFGVPYNKLAIVAELAHFETGIPLGQWVEGKEYICSFYVNDAAKSEGKKWAKVNAPAPIDLLRGGKLKRKGALVNGE